MIFCILVELDEDNIPDFEHVRIIHVDERRSISPSSDAIEMDLRTWTTRTNVTCEERRSARKGEGEGKGGGSKIKGRGQGKGRGVVREGKGGETIYTFHVNIIIHKISVESVDFISRDGQD